MPSFATVSDIHENYPDSPASVDALLIAGDVFGREFWDRKQELVRQFHALPAFIRFLAFVEADTVILISGNHDYLFELLGLETTNHVLNNELKKYSRTHSVTVPKVIYLENSGTEFQGLQIWGTPLSAQSPSGLYPRTKAFVLNQDDYCEQVSLPKKQAIILSHNSPNLTKEDHTPIDSTKAGMSLEKEIINAAPEIFISGHFHWMRGTYSIGSTKVINPSATRAYPPKPEILDKNEPNYIPVPEDPYFYFEISQI